MFLNHLFNNKFIRQYFVVHSDDKKGDFFKVQKLISLRNNEKDLSPLYRHLNIIKNVIKSTDARVSFKVFYYEDDSFSEKYLLKFSRGKKTVLNFDFSDLDEYAFLSYKNLLQTKQSLEDENLIHIRLLIVVKPKNYPITYRLSILVENEIKEVL